MAQHLLFIDDDPHIRMILSDFLISEGYEVTCAASGEEALKLLPTITPDLVILDMGMPGIGGTGFLERITTPHGRTQIPVLVLTARGELAEFFADKQIGGFLTKPTDPEELLAEVQRILFVERALPETDLRVLGNEVRPLIVLAEMNPTLANAHCEALSKAGFTVEVVHTGGEAVETVIARRPAGLILPMDAAELSADLVLEILRKLPSSKQLPVIVYAAESKPHLWSFINPKNVTRVDGRNSATIAQAMRTALQAERVN